MFRKFQIETHLSVESEVGGDFQAPTSTFQPFSVGSPKVRDVVEEQSNLSQNGFLSQMSKQGLIFTS